MSLFRMGEAPGGGAGEGERWGWAVLLAALIHAGLLLVGMSASATPAPVPAAPEEPELVFFSFPPPPPAASRAVTSRAAMPEPVRRQARSRVPRPASLLPVPVPAPVAETVNLETEQVPHGEEVEHGTVAGPEGVSGVISGLVGGVVGGREGGLVGATGGTALDLKQVARPPGVLEQVKPRYPRRARADGIEGLVLVRVIIGTNGRIEPEHTRVIRSVPALDAAAISAVSQWRFSPALGREGRPVRVIVEIPIEFSLK